MHSEKLRRFLVGALLFAAVLGVFWKTASNGFVFDDSQYLLDNRHIQAGVTVGTLRWAFTTAYASNWHPLTWISHALDWQLYGSDPMGHHLTSVLIHAVNTVLLLIVLTQMTGAFWRSAFAAAVFGLHPLRLESVAWVAERKDVLAGLFWLLTMLAYVGYVRKRTIGRYALVAAALALGLMAKPMLVSLPLVLLLLDYWPLGRLQVAGCRLQRLLTEKVPLFALALGSCVVTFWAQREGGSVSQIAAIPLTQRLANAAVSYVVYLRKMLWPSDLAVYYPHPLAGLPVWEVAASAILLVAITWLALRAARTRGYALVGWLWYVVVLVPVIGLVQVGGQAAADRYTYIPMIGVLIVVAWGAPELAGRVLSARTATAVLGAAAGIAILSMAASTYSQIDYWRDDTTLFTHALEVNPDNWMAHYSLGHVSELEADIDEAESQFAEAARLCPESAMAQSAYASILTKLDRPGEAVKYFVRALRLDPRSATTHNNLGGALEQLGKRDAAVKEFRRAIELDPDLVQALDNLGTVLARQRKYKEAAAYLARACRLTHNSDMMLLVRLAEVSHRAGRDEDAVRAAHMALKLAEAEGQSAAAEQIRALLDRYER